MNIWRAYMRMFSFLESLLSAHSDHDQKSKAAAILFGLHASNLYGILLISVPRLVMPMFINTRYRIFMIIIHLPMYFIFTSILERAKKPFESLSDDDQMKEMIDREKGGSLFIPYTIVSLLFFVAAIFVGSARFGQR